MEKITTWWNENVRKLVEEKRVWKKRITFKEWKAKNNEYKGLSGSQKGSD